jgi:hypothetical protein
MRRPPFFALGAPYQASAGKRPRIRQNHEGETAMTTTRPAAWGTAGLAGALLLLLSACGEPAEPQQNQGSIAPPDHSVAGLTVIRPAG